VFWFWFFAGPALALAFLSLRGERKRAAYVAERLRQPCNGPFPPATVIVPVKGDDPGLRENLAALDTQDYPDYELIIAAHSAADIPPGVLPPRSRVVLAHGGDPETGEKVLNLRAAVGFARKSSQLFAFADSDGRVSRNWLRALAAPLADAAVGASTG
jgi:cellulose synthase/poly-beta-1,6-N-acetylglucosamine synthase-like glycosyltransferase